MTPDAEKGLREEIARRLYFNQAQQGEHFGTEGPWWDDADAVLDILERRKTRVIPPDMPCEDCEQGLTSCCLPPE